MATRNRKRFFTTIFLLIPCLSAMAQKPMVTVIPFNAVGLSENDVLGITLLFETALQNTDTFTLIEQTQAESILQAQKYSLSGCVDESCAIEIGRLLSADQIVLGTVGKVADLYYLTVKIIDVQSGQNLVAKKIQNRSMTSLVENLDSFALLLTGKDASAISTDVRLSNRNERTQQREVVFTSGRYIGEVRDGQPNGHGIFYYVNGDRYEGVFLDNKFNGWGTYYFADGDRHEGRYQNGQPDGQGIYYRTNGDRYDGSWSEGSPTGGWLYRTGSTRKWVADWWF